MFLERGIILIGIMTYFGTQWRAERLWVFTVLNDNKHVKWSIVHLSAMRVLKIGALNKLSATVPGNNVGSRRLNKALFLSKKSNQCSSLYFIRFGMISLPSQQHARVTPINRWIEQADTPWQYIRDISAAMIRFNSTGVSPKRTLAPRSSITATSADRSPMCESAQSHILKRKPMAVISAAPHPN